MATTSIYLNFTNKTEEAFLFYQSIFGGEFEGSINRFGEMPVIPGAPQLSEEDRHLVLHMCLPILGGIKLMGSDAPQSMGFNLVQGNTIFISLHPDTKEEADRLFGLLSAGGTIGMPMAEQFWSDYFGDCTDKYGIRWMVNYSKS